MRLADGPQPVEQPAVVGDLDHGAAELLMLGALDLAAELGAEGLLAIADAEDRQVQLEDLLRGARRLGAGHRGRAAGEDDGAGAEVADALGRRVEGQDLAVDAALAHPPGDELGYLRAEVEDENPIRHGAGK